MDAYCVKCKTKREIEQPIAEFNANGSPVTRGVCSVCGTKLYRLGSTPAHEGMKSPGKVQKKRNGRLVIVESPAKAKTVGRFLGRAYTVKASVGHVRDLLRSSLSVDIENGFLPKYRVPNEKREVVKEIKKHAQEAEEVFLATDPDREGEAIAWHLLEAAQIDPKIARRVVFHEITKPAIEHAFENPRQIDMDLVDAQQARRILDRLVGYSISPILWQKVRSRLSAGRVQSVALRLIVEREREIENFKPVEYWTIDAEFSPKADVQQEPSTYIAHLTRIDAKEVELGSQDVVNTILADMESARYEIAKIKRGERRRKPSAPFTTSTLQQEASKKLGFTAKRTMAIAQQLYEGLDIGEEGGTTGLITYMRTDSTNISEVAQQEAKSYILNTYGQDYLPETPHVFKSRRAVAAQEAHEAIRPTSVNRLPQAIKDFLNKDQFRLYQLIWQRFVASQMQVAVFDTLTIEVTGKTAAHEYLLRTSASTLRFPGFLVVYEEARDEDEVEDGEEGMNVRIPANLVEGQEQELQRLIPEQHFTQPPPRYTEATLVRTLEENGIGRPSTYAPILSTIQARGYVLRQDKRLIPTETGFLVNDLLVQHFPDIVNIGFTARMETDLDKIAAGDARWQHVIGEFYDSFEPEVQKAQSEMPVMNVGFEKIDRTCPECGHDLVIRWGRFGKFISCSNFPTCRYTEAYLEKIGVACPLCGGEVVERKSKRGRVFYGCANYPQCTFTSWNRPLAAKCPNCNGTLVVANKREAKCLGCEETFLLEQIEQNNIEEA